MILVIDDDQAVCISLKILLKQAGYEVVLSSDPSEALSILSKRPIELVLLDMNFSIETSGREGIDTLKTIKQTNPNMPVLLMTGWASISLAIEGMKAGAADFISKPWDNAGLLNCIETNLQLMARDQTKNYTRNQLDKIYGLSNIIGEDARFLDVLKVVGKVSNTNASVLIMGESGTGKELIAEAIHQNSARRNKPYVKVNLGGISSSLFESEMFGHKRGAFTDAKNDRVGRFEMANKGSIFLDEIGDLDMASQVKLLRVLQDRTYEVLGESQSRSVDVRVICATNHDLSRLVADNRFREDLYYRINLVIIKLPPLRERRDDIPLLADYFLSNLKDVYSRPELKISAKAFSWLKTLSFFGNIRELKNLVERTVLFSDKDTLEIKDFEQHLEFKPKNESRIILPDVGTLTIDEVEHLMIQRAMDHYSNNISRVAKSLGLSRGTLYRKLEQYNIPYEAQK